MAVHALPRLVLRLLISQQLPEFVCESCIVVIREGDALCDLSSVVKDQRYKLSLS